MANRYRGLEEIMNSNLFDQITAPIKPKSHSMYDPEVEKFLEIVEFYKNNGREPERTDDSARFNERLLASRLIGIRKNTERIKKLSQYDEVELLKPRKFNAEVKSIEDILSSASLALLDGEEEKSKALDIFNVSRFKEIENRPDYIAKRKNVSDFSKYEYLFRNVQQEIAKGARKIVAFKNYEIKEGSFFVQKGVLLYVASIGEYFKTENGEDNARLHVIYENGTESDVLLRSLAANLYRTSGKIVTDNIEHVMSGVSEEDIAGGVVYVLKSLSQDPQITSIKDLYKVGVTKGAVKKRIANAANESTYLYAPVEIVTAFHIYNLDAGKFETAIHRILKDHKLDVEIVGANGRMLVPREWFVISLNRLEEIINELITKVIISD